MDTNKSYIVKSVEIVSSGTNLVRIKLSIEDNSGCLKWGKSIWWNTYWRKLMQVVAYSVRLILYWRSPVCTPFVFHQGDLVYIMMLRLQVYLSPLLISVPSCQTSSRKWANISEGKLPYFVHHRLTAFVCNLWSLLPHVIFCFVRSMPQQFWKVLFINWCSLYIFIVHTFIEYFLEMWVGHLVV